MGHFLIIHLSSVVRTNLVCGHTLSPLVGIGLLYLPKHCQDKSPCLYMISLIRTEADLCDSVQRSAFNYDGNEES